MNSPYTTLLLAALTLPSWAAEPAAKAPIAIVNGVAISTDQLALIQAERKTSGKAASDEKAIRNNLITLEVLAQEARKNGLDQQPEFRIRTELMTRQRLADAAVQHLASEIKISDAELHAAYDEIKDREGTRIEFHTRHILVKNEAQARKLLEQLHKSKVKFDELARKYSQDPGSKENGGDLGWVSQEGLVSEFAKVMAETKPGQLAKAPIKTKFGWHIIRVEATRPLQFPTFEDSKDDLHGQLLNQRIRRAVAEKVTAAKVE